MKRKTTVIITVFITFIVLVLAGLIRDRQLRAVAANKAAIFISVDWMIRREINSGSGAPDSIDDIISRSYQSYFFKVFPSGLKYIKNSQNSFTLEQRKEEFVSLFKRDILVSNQDQLPRYKEGESVSRK
jgi:hypothetical protein